MDTNNSQEKNIALAQGNQAAIATPNTEQRLDASLPATSDQAGGAADDLDQIEAAWISRVEHIFNSYADDPKVLSEQFAEAKAEYITRRYGISVKKADE